MGHIIDFKETTKPVVEHDLAYCSGGGENKSLVVATNIQTKVVKFLVYNHGEVVGEFDDLELAVTCYNEN